MKKIIYLVGLITVLAACKKQNEYLPPNFNYKIDPVTITENVNVGAYFSSYAAADWAKKYTYTPVNGEYIATTPTIMEQERQWADQAGIDFFIFNWTGSAANTSLLNAFAQGRTSKVKMVINYSVSHLGATNASPLTGAKLTTMINELKTLATTQFNQDYYYTINGQPVIMITPLNFSTSTAASVNYATVIPAVKQALSAAGVNLYIIGEITSGWLPPVRYANNAKAMDAVVLSDWSTDMYDRAVFMPAYTDQNWKNWTDSTSKWKKDFVPCIFPGFNNKATAPTTKLFTIDRSASFYTDMCNVAKRNMSANRIVIVNSWNNFQMGTTIEPAKEYGTTYLDITRKQFKIN